MNINVSLPKSKDIGIGETFDFALENTGIYTILVKQCFPHLGNIATVKENGTIRRSISILFSKWFG